MSYEVHLDVFDGPFDLLLQLITAQEVDLYEVRLADIIDGFLGELKKLEALDLELATEFLLIAAILIELKCRRLLPGSDDLDFDDDLALFEARDYLLARLVECKTFSGAAAVLAALEQGAQQSVGRRAGPDERFAPVAADLLAGVSALQLRDTARAALVERPVPTVSVSHINLDEVSVASVIADLRAEVATKGRTTFRELTRHGTTKAYIVACFLAVLELYKAMLVELDQGATFGELVVTWSGRDEEPGEESLWRRGGEELEVDEYDQNAGLARERAR